MNNIIDYRVYGLNLVLTFFSKNYIRLMHKKVIIKTNKKNQFSLKEKTILKIKNE